MRTFPKSLWMTTPLLAALAFGCSPGDEDGDELAALEEGVPCDPAIDAGLGTPDEADGGVDGDADVEEDADASAPDATRPRPDPNVPYIVDVKANGTGCLPGTWATSISDDGSTFKTTFSEYTAEMNSNQSLAVKDCLLSVALKSPHGMSFAVSSFKYSGYVLLEKGVTGFQSSNYYFQGSPAAANKEKRTDLTGPVDRSYLFEDTVTTADAIWSPCGKDRLLQIPTRIQVRRAGEGTGVGYISLNQITDIKLAWRKCDS